MNDMSTFPKDHIERIRHFNRFYTHHMGLFSRDHLGTGHSVTELRTLYEVCFTDKSAREIAAELELDEGYISRVLNTYAQKGWLERVPSETDKRRKDLRPTEEGRKQLQVLWDATNVETERRLRGVDARAVADTMAQLERLFRPLAPDEVTFRDVETGDLGWLIQRNGELYREEYDFNFEFEVFAADILVTFLQNFDPKRDAAFIAARGEERLGSIFCEHDKHDPDLAKLRVFFVERHARGIGLGARLMEACLGFARQAGYKRMTLGTLDTQKAARRQYARFGFEIVEATPVRLFGQDVTEEMWEVTL
ncbi:MAG: bifunctional helix-turn-helix transcriptional regulator/GNAT family N-acetyltransferase [Pseudomonadota bacterium]